MSDFAHSPIKLNNIINTKSHKLFDSNHNNNTDKKSKQ